MTKIKHHDENHLKYYQLDNAQKAYQGLEAKAGGDKECTQKIKSNPVDCNESIARDFRQLERYVTQGKVTDDPTLVGGFVIKNHETGKVVSDAEQFDKKGGVDIVMRSPSGNEGVIFTVKSDVNGNAVFESGEGDRKTQFNFDGLKFKDVDFDETTTPDAFKKFEPILEAENQIENLQAEKKDLSEELDGRVYGREDNLESKYGQAKEGYESIKDYKAKWDEFHSKPENQEFMKDIRQLSSKAAAQKAQGHDLRASMIENRINRKIGRNPEFKALCESMGITHNVTIIAGDQRLSRMDERYAIAQGIDSPESESRYSKANVDALEGQVDAHRTRINTINQEIAELKTKIDELRQ